MNLWNLLNRTYVGAGWFIWHRTDRNVALRKECPIYRKITGFDGYVNFAVQPGMSPDEAMQGAIELAQKNDEKVAFLVAQDIIPKASRVQTYQMQAHRLNRAFKTPESPSVIGRKHA